LDSRPNEIGWQAPAECDLLGVPVIAGRAQLQNQCAAEFSLPPSMRGGRSHATTAPCLNPISPTTVEVPPLQVRQLASGTFRSVDLSATVHSEPTFAPPLRHLISMGGALDRSRHMHAPCRTTASARRDV